ncbi:aspartate dehydrogenase [Jannaschia seohaensis]|uniref:L-aspartate dehydrogenase n=1 Tax=Jannaschia seohaensis TaxID=475081 RepID=A0A2Y9AV68_9RHOB|nr:aspartate dehydrogenase [Jannaschia seohaensis]PWJ16967.1 aspartate dehydrogenase [Jannaschia seohaensis]SSA48240.1 aspartate dehydrogenase [Jannaschia seohaensis]
MTIGIIGEGAIGRYVRAHLEGVTVALVRPGREGPGRVASVDALPGDLRLMLDCAGHQALAQFGPEILARGIDLVTVSLGALADDALHGRLREAARTGGARLHLASGAIGALDALAAARVGGLDAVTYAGRKPPAGWRGSAAEPVLGLDALTAPAAHFEGTAREAALRYPKNANVAAAVALAGAGFDATRVRLIADPDAPGNVHEIEARGAFGRFSFRIEGRALPDNPRSAALAAMSVVAAVLRRAAPVGI